MTIAHIIRNDEVSITECDLLIDPPAQDPVTREWSKEPVVLPDGTIAIWDNVIVPKGSWTCHKCWKAYIAEVPS